MKKLFLLLLSDIKGRIFLSFFLIITFLLLLFFSLGTHNVLEKDPLIQSYEPEKDRKFGDAPPHIEVGLFVRSMPQFDIDNGQFSLIGSIWFYYYPSQTSISDIKNFKIDRGEIIQKSEPRSKKIKDRILTVFDINVNFSSELNYLYFPFSDHKLYLVLKFPQSTAQEMLLTSGKSNIIVDKDLLPKGWTLTDVDVNVGFYSEQLDENEKNKFLSNPQMYFTLNFSKPGFRKILVIIIPALILFFLAVLSLIIKVPENNTIPLNLSLAAISGMLVHRFVIENISPKVGYFTTADSLYVAFISCAFISFLINLVHDNNVIYWRFRFISSYVMQVFIIIYFYFLVLRGL